MCGRNSADDTKKLQEMGQPEDELQCEDPEDHPEPRLDVPARELHHTPGAEDQGKVEPPGGQVAGHPDLSTAVRVSRIQVSSPGGAGVSRS